MARGDRRALRALRVLGCLAVVTLCSGCGLFGGGDEDLVRDPAIVDFAERIDLFYRSLENTPLDVRATFDNPELRSFFENEADFASYYASLANGVRRALLRNATAREVTVDEFRFEAEDTAVVEVRFVGKHTRRLRLGDVEIARKDTWRRRDGRWVVSPERL